MIYPIVVYGDPVLRKKAINIQQGDLDVDALINDMFETMENAEGIGLAAPQIGKSLRLFVIDAKATEEEELLDFRKIFINAEIIREEGEEWDFNEGCLSIPEIREDVLRKDTLRIKYVDENWMEHDEVYSGMKARIIQHEYDHIEGILFTDHLNPLKKRLLRGKLISISKGKVHPAYKIKAPLAK